MSGFADWLLDILQQILQFVVDIPFAVIDWLWRALLNLIDSSFIVDAIENAAALFSQIPASVWYFMDMMQLTVGIPLITSAYFLRFLIRRIPFIG
ncbi:hypothetical protein ACK56M_14640 [Pseudomonas sp. s4]|uniref:hypothetical protein n=1 Tax=Pseudomonas sp. s4 TaxID=353218 RepID=UPI00398CD280